MTPSYTCPVVLSDRLIAAAIVILVVASRLPFVGTILYHWDSVNYALALGRFDVRAHQPHPPGYVLYIVLARAVDWLFGDAQRSFVAISVVSSGLAIAVVYLLGATLFERRIGLAAAAFLASSPLFWFGGVIATPHCLDAFVVVGAVGLCVGVRRGHRHWDVAAAIWLGVAGGIRPQTQLFLAPLAVFTAGAQSWRRRLLCLALLIVVDLAWFVPLVTVGGGLASYLRTLNEYYLSSSAITSVFAGGGWLGLSRNLQLVTIYTLYGWGCAAVLLPLATLTLWRRRAVALTLTDSRLWIMFLWATPATAYYVLIHMGQQGLTFVYLSALLLCTAWALARAWPRYFALVSTAVVVGNALIFVAAPTYPLGDHGPKILTADTLRRHDSAYLRRFAALSQHFDPHHSIVVASSWRWVQYYLPQFPLLEYTITARHELVPGVPERRDERRYWAPDLGLTPDENGVVTVILFDEVLWPFNDNHDREVAWPLGEGETLRTIDWRIGESLELGPNSFGIAAQ